MVLVENNSECGAAIPIIVGYIVLCMSHDVGTPSSESAGLGWCVACVLFRARRTWMNFCLSAPRSAFFLLLAALVLLIFGCLAGLVEFSSRFKCTWYGLPHPVQFMVLILVSTL
ncbi:unnamed protein product [Ectocarpus sp. 12 AP-2014]